MSEEKKPSLPGVKVNVDISTKDLAPVAHSLIEKIAKATGVFYEPWRITRQAKAIRKAGKALADLEELGFSDLEMRTLQRVISESSKHQENVDRITLGATEALKDEAKPEDIDDDWMADFFSKARHISNDDISALWSKILAGEANQPRSFSKRTLSLIYALSKEEAELFRELCRYTIIIDSPTPFVWTTDQKIHNFRFDQLNHLQDLGLINFNNIGIYTKNNLPVTAKMFYGPIPIEIEKDKRRSNDQNTIKTGNVIFTKSGLELFKIADAPLADGFEHYVAEKIGMSAYKATVLPIP